MNHTQEDNVEPKTLEEHYREFAEANKIRLEVKPTTHNQNMDNGTEMDHFWCVLTRGGDTTLTYPGVLGRRTDVHKAPHMGLVFSKGIGLRVATRKTHAMAAVHGEDYPKENFPFQVPRVMAEKNFNDLCEGVPPTIGELFETIVDDAMMEGEHDNFEVWAASLGYDSDSRSAFKIFEAVNKQTKDFKNMLGPDLFRKATKLRLEVEMGELA